MIRGSLKRWSVILLALLGFGITIALAACNPDTLKVRSAQVSQLVSAMLAEPKTFNAALSNSVPNVFPFTFSGLVDEHGVTAEVLPDLAESWTVSEDKLRFTFTLRQGLKWSDGHSLTADDVLFSFNDVYLNEKIPTGTQDVLRIGTSGKFPAVRKLDERRVEFILPEPFAPFLRTMSASILPAHILRKTVYAKDADGKPQFMSTWGTDTDPSKIVVNGPYRIESYTPSQRIVYRRNPYYWRKDAQGQSLPYIDRLIMQIVENPDVRLLQFRSGDLDVADVRVVDFQLLKREEQRGDFTIVNGGPDSGKIFLAFNLNRAKNEKGKSFVDPIKSKWFNSKEFRQAIAYSLDRQTLINNLYRGLGELQNSPVSVQSPYYLKPEEGLKTYNYDVSKSKSLLQSAGFKYDSRGQLFDADNHRIRIRLALPAGSPRTQQIGAQIQQDLKKIGVQLDLDPVDFNVLVERIDARDWEMYFLAFTGGVEPNGGSNFWMTTGSSHNFNQGPQPGKPPISGWVVSDWEKEIDRLLIAGAKEFDEAKRKQIYAQFQQIVQEQVPVIYLVNPTTLSAARNNVKNIQFSGLDWRGSLWNIYELKVVNQ